MNHNFADDRVNNFLLTRMHSSRMRTGRSLTVCWSLLPRGGVSAPGWGVCSQGGLVPGGSGPWGSAPGGSAPGDSGLSGGVWSGGVWSRGDLLLGGISQHALRQTPLPPLWTDRCLWKYYLGPTSLRPVMNIIIIEHTQKEPSLWHSKQIAYSERHSTTTSRCRRTIGILQRAHILKANYRPQT